MHTQRANVCAGNRAAEYEADAIGVRLMARACYDPDANVTMLQKLNKVQAGSEAAHMPEFMSTHPLTQVRGACNERR